MKYIYTLILLLIFSNEIFAQSSVTIFADRDNTIYSENTNSNGAGANFFAGSNSALNKRRGLLHFNLSSVPVDATISSATLNLTALQLASGAAGRSIDVNKLTADWGEGTSSATGQGAAATPNDATWIVRFTGTPSNWGTAGGDFNPASSGSVAVAMAGAVTVTGSGILNDVQSWISTPASNFGWIITGNETVAQSAISFGTKENGATNARPSITITYTTLPITLGRFTAQVLKQDVLLNWQTITEINNQYFSVEQSTNGTSFTEIGRVTGAGNSILPKNYHFSNINAGSGKHFYRLAQYDFNGAVHYSQVVLVDVNATKQLLIIAPNPVQALLNVRASELLTGNKYQITNNAGQVVISGSITSQQIAVDRLTKGTYQLIIRKENNEVISAAFLKD